MNDLLDDLELLCLDAGNTVVFFDHDAAAEAATAAGFPLSASALADVEGEAKRSIGGRLSAPVPGIPVGWSEVVRTMVERAGIGDGVGCTRALWAAHREFNLWRRVPDGLVDALADVRAAGVPIAIVSNAEGALQQLFERVGLGEAFDLVLDSHLVGVEKPDPRIFRLATDHFDVRPDKALHLGDIVPIDIAGARQAGLRAALVDPFGYYEGLHLDVERVSVSGVCRKLVDRTL